MMQSMRNLAHTKVVKGLMIILMVSFALWGIGDIFRGNPLERTVAKVGNQSISVQALNREFEQQLIRTRQIMGPEFTAQQAKQMGILDKTLNGMIQKSSIDQAIKKLGLEVSAKTVLDEVAAQPQFRDKDGNFNRALFRQLLEQAHLNESNFLAEGQKDMQRQQIITALSPSSQPPQLIVDALYNARGQKRFVNIVTVNNESITSIPLADDKTLQDYFAQNPKPFTAPEYRALTIARLSTDDIAKDITITDDQVKKEYDDKQTELKQPERRDIVQIVLQDEAKAKALAEAAKTSGNLTKSGKMAGYDAIPINGSDEKSLPSELAKPVFTLQTSQVSDPIKTGLGWHIVQVKKITPEGVPAYSEIKDELRQTMQRNQAIESLTKLVNQLDDELAAGHALEDVADGMKLRLIKIVDVDANGKLSDGKEPAELPFKTDVLKTAFAQNNGDTSPILDDKNGNYIVVRTDNVTASAPKPFEQVKNEVAALWKADQQAKFAKEQAEKIAQALREGKTPASFAHDKGVSVRVSDGISMLGDNDDELPPSLLPQVFHLKKGDVVAAPAGNKQYVMQLKELAAADPAVGEHAKLKITEELNKTTPSELTQEYIDYLRLILTVDIKEDVLESVRQQGS